MNEVEFWLRLNGQHRLLYMRRAGELFFIRKTDGRELRNHQYSTKQTRPRNFDADVRARILFKLNTTDKTEARRIAHASH